MAGLVDTGGGGVAGVPGCGGETGRKESLKVIQREIDYLSNCFNDALVWTQETTAAIEMAVNGIDWGYIVKETIKSTVVCAIANAGAGAYAGYIGVPITAGLSIPACALVGAAIGAVEGVLVGFFGALFNELWG